ncbi:MAG: hypothetical protein HYX67_02520 [Candidatus Melainabacteria bacterium]|nr:hypothetical protein [Candidatus Melainabacteria bacterium]
MELSSWNLGAVGQIGSQMKSGSSLSGFDRKSIKLACVTAFTKLNQQFSGLVFDLRRSSFQDFETSFEQIKSQIEQMLNSLNYDRPRLVLAFNSEARPVCSGDNQSFDVRATLSDSGRIVLQFMDR